MCHVDAWIALVRPRNGKPQPSITYNANVEPHDSETQTPDHNKSHSSRLHPDISIEGLTAKPYAFPETPIHTYLPT